MYEAMRALPVLGRGCALHPPRNGVFLTLQGLDKRVPAFRPHPAYQWDATGNYGGEQ